MCVSCDIMTRTTRREFYHLVGLALNVKYIRSKGDKYKW